MSHETRAERRARRERERALYEKYSAELRQVIFAKLTEIQTIEPSFRWEQPKKGWWR